MPVSHMMLLKSTLKPLGILGGIPLPPLPPALSCPNLGRPSECWALDWVGFGSLF